MHKKLIISGPCSAETAEQVFETAKGVVMCQHVCPSFDYIFRAGIWKPRTSPDTFQGIGEIGLTWLQRIRQELNLKVAIEVATPEQVHIALRHNMDYLWVGARTSANPIAVQSIANAIKEFRAQNAACHMSGVLVKNPVNEDVALWIGNIERLEMAGVPVMAVHRGCNHRPCWQMVYALKQRRPDISLVMDPSHLSGKSSAVAELCIKAQQLDYQGWMIETHISPHTALSDAQQQITPTELGEILERLEVGDGTCQTTELDWLRCMIDEVDDDLWDKMALRMDICRRIGAWKKQKQMPIVQIERYQQVVGRRIAWAREHNLDGQTVEQIMEAIHKESVRVQS